jgi:hypothetical protein
MTIAKNCLQYFYLRSTRSMHLLTGRLVGAEEEERRTRVGITLLGERRRRAADVPRAENQGAIHAGEQRRERYEAVVARLTCRVAVKQF